MQEDLNIRTTLCNKEAVRDSEVVIVAVKPHIVAHVLDEVSSVINKDQIIISLAAGTKLETMAEVGTLYMIKKFVTSNTYNQNLPEGAQVARAMPNTPCSVGAGMTAIAVGSTVTKENLQKTKDMFSSVGVCRLMSEGYLDIITGLSGCGPTYVSLWYKQVHFVVIIYCVLSPNTYRCI